MRTLTVRAAFAFALAVSCIAAAEGGPATGQAGGSSSHFDSSQRGEEMSIQPMVGPSRPGEKTLANGLYLNGSWNAVWLGATVTGTLGAINNDSFTRTSGTLRLELWAVTSPPGRNVAFTGYRLAVFDQLNPMPPRTQYTNLAGQASMSYPPNGTYWLNLVLTEFDSSSCSLPDRFCMQDSSISNATATFGTAPPPVPNFGNFTDLWWNASESGWGMSVTHHSSGIIFIAWYTYDGFGNPKWYVASNCRIVSNFCSDTLYETNGPAFGPTFNPSAVQVRSVGTISLSFSSLNSGTMNYNVRGSTGTKAITRQSF